MYYIGQLLEEQDITEELKTFLKENDAYVTMVTDTKYEIRRYLPNDPRPVEIPEEAE